jgi:ankyrin repeat protein
MTKPPLRGTMPSIAVRDVVLSVTALLWVFAPPGVAAQVPPSPAERAAYTGLLDAAARGNVADVNKLIATKADLNQRDPSKRTPLHVAAFGSHYNAVRALVAAGGDINALEFQRYDVITIAAVKDDV